MSDKSLNRCRSLSDLDVLPSTIASPAPAPIDKAPVPIEKRTEYNFSPLPVTRDYSNRYAFAREYGPLINAIAYEVDDEDVGELWRQIKSRATVVKMLRTSADAGHKDAYITALRLLLMSLDVPPLEGVIVPQRKRGSRVKNTTRLIVAKFKELGYPAITANLCAQFAKEFFEVEYKRAKDGSLAQKRLKSKVSTLLRNYKKRQRITN